MKINKCFKCGYEWLPRQSEVKQCPKCKSYNWEKKDESEE